MKFEWNPRKNQENISKHKLDFVDAPTVFRLPLRVSLDQRQNFGEERLIGIGLLNGRIVVIVFTEPDEQTVRIISFRKALPHERKQYEQYLSDGLGGV